MGFWSRFFGPPTEDKFAQLVIKTLARIGDDRSPVYDKSDFRLMFTQDGKDAGVMNLRNLYIEYCQAPRRERAKFLKQTCLSLAQRMEVPEVFEDAKPDLLPRICCQAMLESLRLEHEKPDAEWKELPHIPLSEHLFVAFVYDLPRSVAFVNADTLQGWGVSHYEALEVAKQNLQELPFAVAVIGEKLRVVMTGDSYDATRMLLVEHLQGLQLEGQPVVLPVNRDALLVAGSDDEAGLDMMAELAEAKRDDARPICPIPHILVDGDWQVWDVPSDRSYTEKFRVLERRYYYGLYQEQKSILEKATDGPDVFVATYGILERDGQPFSWATWSKGVPTWLPRTDCLALFDTDTEKFVMVSWDRAVAIVGDLLEPLSMYPPRWSVCDFPTPEQIAAIGPLEMPSRGDA